MPKEGGSQGARRLREGGRLRHLVDPFQRRWSRASGESGVTRRCNQALQDSQGRHTPWGKDAGEHEGQSHKFSVLAQEAIDWYVNHDRRDVRNFKGRMKFILEAFADRVADEIKPSEIDAWISSHKWSPATKNRYKNVFGKLFKIALADGKVTSNPARPAFWGKEPKQQARSSPITPTWTRCCRRPRRTGTSSISKP
jgi:hypothetical protein